eukprot:SAG11_NODE_28173_length_324_cov_3.680000_1_plen_29_part_10
MRFVAHMLSDNMVNWVEDRHSQFAIRILE